MTTVAYAKSNNQTLATAAQGKQSGWFGTSCGLCLLAGLVLLYIPVVLPFCLVSCALRALRGQ